MVEFSPAPLSMSESVLGLGHVRGRGVGGSYYHFFFRRRAEPPFDLLNLSKMFRCGPPPHDCDNPSKLSLCFPHPCSFPMFLSKLPEFRTSPRIDATQYSTSLLFNADDRAIVFDYSANDMTSLVVHVSHEVFCTFTKWCPSSPTPIPTPK